MELPLNSYLHFYWGKSSWIILNETNAIFMGVYRIYSKKQNIYGGLLARLDNKTIKQLTAKS